MIKLNDILKDCEYERVFVKVRTWNAEGIQEEEENFYIEKGEKIEELEMEVCGFKWRGELDKDCPVLCINRGAHWIEFDPESRKAIDMCQISDGYQAYLTRKKVMRS